MMLETRVSLYILRLWYETHKKPQFHPNIVLCIHMICIFILEVCSLPNVTNGNASYSMDGITKSGEATVIQCNPGYEPSRPDPVCQQNRTWLPEPSCIQITCRVIPIENGYYLKGLIPVGQVEPYETIIQPHFVYGYNISHSIPRTCLQDGLWSDQSPTCVKILCNDTSNIEQNAIDAFPVLEIGDFGDVSYNSSLFVLKSGETSVKCLRNGQLDWTQPPEFGKKHIL